MPAFTPTLGQSPLREAIRALTRAPEPGCVQALMTDAQQPPAKAETVNALALRLAEGVRCATRQRAGLLGSGGRAGLVQGLLQEFALSSQEGVALMCLAEALLRIPDAATRDALIRDKISRGDWRAHLGRSPSPFVNAAAWGLLLTGQLVSTHSDARLGGALKRVLARGGEPLVRKGVDMAMRLMGEQFVTGQTIEEALNHAGPREARGFRFSYDMLGEAALTDADARAYLAAYEHAIDAIGAAAAGRGIVQGPGISIKLSALHPRYSRAQAQRVMDELYPRLLHLAQRARQHDIGLNIDAEESERLDLSLDLLERLCFEPSLAGWNGVGFVIQAYGKRCPAVIDFIIDLARRSQRRLMVRLVKGAYWDSEIKRAQLDGLSDYPVYTRKAHTDVAYLACARQLLAAPDAIYPQFATHNAHTLAAVHEMAGPDAPADAYEFQCLHGMGETLYEQVVASSADGGLGRPCRIYAPVGTHETLLAYLVRRLLENGANTSFVNRVADESLPLEALVEDPVQTVRMAAEREGLLGAPHPAIARPADLYRHGKVSESGVCPGRENAAGLDLADEATLARLGQVVEADPSQLVDAMPLASADAVQAALAAAQAEFARADGWAAWPPAQRAQCLERAADALQADTDALIALLVREAGKTVANAVAEIREAVDFLRFYGGQIRQGWQADTHRPLGPVVCISPWNFPLAIFLGQVAAALAAGNTVLAKPAEQTPLVAQRAVVALHAAGVPAAALHLLPGDGPNVGAALVGDARVQAVLFTGSTEVARLLQRTVAQRLDARGRPVTLVAETGGQNALVVDSSALLEQVTLDVLVSAFDSAGQRCSALRVLCVQDDVADRLIEMIEGALRTWRVGDPRQLATDVGPVIDEDARASIEAHIAAMRARGLRILQPAQVDPQVLPPGAAQSSHDGTDGPPTPAVAHRRPGHFVTPTLIEIDDLSVLKREVFGPVLHVLRYRREELPMVLEQVRATGYGLTMGVHSRIDETITQVVQASRTGNLYVNRTIVGAVVGVQPFGGEGLSGTGPKAGGPLYLLRLLAERPDTAALQAVEACGSTAEVPVRGLATPEGRLPALQALSDWAEATGPNALMQTLMALEAQRPRQAHACWRALPGPTGEANLYAVTGREHVLCLADDGADRLTQLAAVLAVGVQAVWPAECSSLRDRLPAAVREAIVLARDWRDPCISLDAALHHGDTASRQAVLQALAERPGPIVTLTALNPGDRRIPLERLWLERSLNINTAAAGGNASLMTLGEG